MGIAKKSTRTIPWSAQETLLMNVFRGEFFFGKFHIIILKMWYLCGNFKKKVIAKMPKETEAAVDDALEVSGGVYEAVLAILEDMRPDKASDNIRKHVVQPDKSVSLRFSG